MCRERFVSHRARLHHHRHHQKERKRPSTKVTVKRGRCCEMSDVTVNYLYSMYGLFFVRFIKTKRTSDQRQPQQMTPGVLVV